MFKRGGCVTKEKMNIVRGGSLGGAVCYAHTGQVHQCTSGEQRRLIST